MVKLKNAILILVFLSNCLSDNTLIAQKEDLYNLFVKFSNLYTSGDFIGAEKCMLSVLGPENKLSTDYTMAAYNNLGLIKKNLGLYTEALNYYNNAENLMNDEKENSIYLADIYINKSRIYTFQRSFSTAIEFLERAIRVYQSIEKPDHSLLYRISTAYLNLGIVHYELKDYKNAVNNLEESLQLKIKYNLPEIELAYLALAKVYSQTEENIKAEEFFNKSIDRFIKLYGNNNYRLAEVFFDYGLFLRSEDRLIESLNISQKALSICHKSYGDKHPYVSLSFRNLGDYYLYLDNYDSSLYYYQESLKAIVNDFSENDINKNPGIDSVILDVDLLKTLRKKSETLELSANHQGLIDLKIQILHTSLETVELALVLIDRIRNNYLTEESRIYLAENEKETYLSAVHISSVLFRLTGDRSFKEKMYRIAQKAKSAVLRNEIIENELVYSAGISDSLRVKKNALTRNIAAYTYLVLAEKRKIKPDSVKISLWKDALFEMNREKERLGERISKEFPKYNELIGETEPATLARIQKSLERDETIVDYLISNQYKNGERNLYIFLITRNYLKIHEASLDSLFSIKTEIIRKADNQYQNSEFMDFTGALSYLYENLVKPVEEFFAGNRLIIIPDEEITWLPFDALLRNPPGIDQRDYEGLKYLIHNYTISYRYTSSQVLVKGFGFKGIMEVFAFAPYYGNSNTPGMAPEPLYGAGKEIESIDKYFRCIKFMGEQATEANYLQVTRNTALFHLAMHSVSDSINSKYSYLLFDAHSDTVEDGKLYNYEISLKRINSPMVVLSACNSGTGTLYHGEGLMSLARGFILAGASSVIRTTWEVNDETSAQIISRFYYHLSKGRYKDEAIRLSKLDYLKVTPPAYSSPHFWAAYELMGDDAPIVINYRVLVLKLSISVIITAGILILYFRRRRIFSDLSL